MTSPLENIEEEKGQRDLGAVARRLIAGAREDGASWWVAFLIVAAWFRGMTAEIPPEDEE